MMNENVKAVLKDSLWYLGTSDGKVPNVVPMAFKNVTEDGKLIIADVFMDTTLKNIAANGQIAIAASNAATLEGYQIKGTAQYLTEGPVVDSVKAMVEGATKGALKAKGAVIVTPEKIIVATPGPNCKTEL